VGQVNVKASLEKKSSWAASCCMAPHSALREELTSSPLLEATSEVDSTHEKSTVGAEIVYQLLKHGAKIDAKNDVRTNTQSPIPFIYCICVNCSSENEQQLLSHTNENNSQFMNRMVSSKSWTTNSSQSSWERLPRSKGPQRSCLPLGGVTQRLCQFSWIISQGLT